MQAGTEFCRKSGDDFRAHRVEKFLRSVLRSSKILLQNGAILRNTLRMLNRQIPGASNAVQNSETVQLVRLELEIRCSIRLSSTGADISRSFNDLGSGLSRLMAETAIFYNVLFRPRTLDQKVSGAAKLSQGFPQLWKFTWWSDVTAGGAGITSQPLIPRGRMIWIADEIVTTESVSLVLRMKR